MVIRPSSSDKDALVVTRMYLAGRFKHIEVQEGGKMEDQGGIGQELTIRGEKEVFSNLDEIFARYIQSMNDLVTYLVAYGCYEEFRPREQEGAGGGVNVLSGCKRMSSGRSSSTSSSSTSSNSSTSSSSTSSSS